MTAALVPFSNGEFTLTIHPHDTDGFHVIAPELARALGFRDAFRLMESIPEEEKGYTLAGTPGGEQRVGYLTEAGFYRALGQRQTARITDTEIRAVVERFQAWVYRDVLPRLRRGELAPARPALPQSYAEALRELASSVEERERLATKVAVLEPAAESWNTLATADGDFLVGDAAKILSRDPRIKIGQNRLFTVLGSLGWIYRAPGDRKWRVKQTAIESGRLSEIPMSHYHPRTGELVLDPPQIRVTVKGLGVLRERLAAGGELESA